MQSNAYYLTLLRYVESNPLRAGLVRRSADWEWSSLAIREGAAKDGLVLAGGPVAVPERWARLVDVRPGEDDLRRLEDCMRRGCPFGSDAWTMAVAEPNLFNKAGLPASPFRTDCRPGQTFGRF